MNARTATVTRMRPLLAVLLIGVAAVVIYIWLSDAPNEPGRPPAGPEFPVPPYTATPYLNVAPAVAFIGSEACAECHRDNHASYKLTPHSRALGDLNLADEPPDATFHHKASNRTYRVYRQGSEFRHEESVRDDKGNEVARADFPIRYLIGSGNFCRSYLIEADGFLHESPLTWYTARKQWDMSPGYDFPNHWSFERPVKVNCLNCHAGRMEPVGRTAHQVTFQEMAIGCERCHGPGALHAERHRAKKQNAGADDLTIVNPGKLSRPLLEAACAECHLSGVASVILRGRGPTDFRPGRPLSDYRLDYKFDAGSDRMTVVGHFEQLRHSTCYQKSADLSCLTCHDPHARTRPKDIVAVQRQQCLNCHADKGCSVPVAERQKKEPRDNCTTCHMPRGDTDIPHIAFTHHRIGRHQHKSAADSGRVPALAPIDDDTRLAPVERQRGLGLAYFQVSENPEHARYANDFRERARVILEEVHDTGLKDADVTQALAQLYWKTDLERTRRYAKEALDCRDIPPDVRAAALMLLADCEFQSGNYKSAISHLEEVTKVRRYAEDWRLLGVSYLLDNQPQPALHALQRGLAIRPTQPGIHGGLFEVYRRVGDGRRAQYHLDRAQWLESHRQQ